MLENTHVINISKYVGKYPYFISLIINNVLLVI